MNDFFSNKLRLLKFILLSIALGNFFISEGYATTKSVVILKSATPFPKCYLHKEEWTFDS